MGKDADIVLFDPEQKFTVTQSKLHMNVDYTPYEGFEVTGMPRAVYARGKKVSQWNGKQMEFVGEIGRGLVVLLGVAEGDTDEDAVWMANKTSQLRIFEDSGGKMNLSVADVGGSVLLISQFTLLASTRKGRRPSFVKAAHPDLAIPLYEHFVELLRGKAPGKVETGEFGAMMEVSLVNDGPVTIWMDSKNRE